MEWKIIFGYYGGACLIFLSIFITMLFSHWIINMDGKINWIGLSLSCIVFVIALVVATLQASSKLDEVATKEKEALSPKLHIGFSPIYDDPEFSPYKYPLYAYSFLIRNDNKASASITDLAISFLFKYKIEKTNAGPILDTGGPIVDGLIITETGSEQPIVTEDRPQKIHSSGAPELRVKQRTVNGKTVNTNQADLACANWPRGCVFRGRVIVNLEKPLILEGMGTYFGQYHYQFKDEIFTEQIRDVIPEAKDALLKAEYHYDQGRDRVDKKQYDEAITEYSKAINQNPNYADAYFNRGSAYAESKKYDEAIEDYNKYIQMKPQDPEGYTTRARVLALKGKDDEAISDYNKALELNPENQDEIHFKLWIIYNNRGISLAAENKHSEAVADFSKAIQMNPNDGRSYYNRSHSLLHLDDKEKAIADMKKACELGIKKACDEYEKLINN